MFQRLLTWTIIAALWRRYGKLLSILPLVLVSIFLISFLHDDYVKYVDVSKNNAYLHWSFLVKWLLIFIVLGAYWFYVRSILNKSGEKQNSVSEKNSEELKSSGQRQNDPFKNIRSKETLRSKADVIIEKGKK